MLMFCVLITLILPINLKLFYNLTFCECFFIYYIHDLLKNIFVKISHLAIFKYNRVLHGMMYICRPS